VAPHYRSAPDHNPYNNWSTKGNVNPYTGKAGTKNVPSTGYPNYATQSSAPVQNALASRQNSLPSPGETKTEGKPSAAEKIEMTTKGHYDDTDPNLELQKQQAQKGFAPSQYSMGIRYLTGNGVPKDEEKGKAFSKQQHRRVIRKPKPS
jgi:TPR repeat protein